MKLLSRTLAAFCCRFGHGADRHGRKRSRLPNKPITFVVPFGPAAAAI
jgi:hypothetical protein